MLRIAHLKQFILSALLWLFSPLALAAPKLPDLVCDIRDHFQTTVNGQPALKFGTWAINLGAGPIELHADSTQPGTTNVYQWIYDTDGSHTENLIGNFVVDGSNRVRFADSADFFLREIMEDGTTGGIVAANEKVAYCFVDSNKYVPSPPGTPANRVYGGSGPGTYPSCGSVLGTSVGWVDDYPSNFTGQYVILTGVSSGTYWLQNILDPLNRVAETNDNNNTDMIQVTINTGLTPEINLLGNGQTIVSGDVTPAAADHTDFGFVDPGSGSVTRTFTIGNSGNGTLSLTGVPRVQVNGDASFVVTTQPTSPVAPNNGSVTFQVTFDPSSLGAKSATIHLVSNDANENTYEFVIRGNTDQDADGLPDDWETLHGVSDPAVDDDGDGTSNGDELIAGTAPGSTSSVFRVTNTLRNSDQFEITWETVPGRTYKLYRGNDLTAPRPWVLVDEWAGTGGPITVMDDADGAESRFYYVTTELRL